MEADEVTVAIPVPTIVGVIATGVFTVNVLPEEVTVAEPIPVMVGVITAATVGELIVKLG